MTPDADPDPTVDLDVGTVDLLRGVLHRGDGGEVALTTKERDVLAHLAARPGQVVERAELLAEVWGYAPSTVTRAVDHTIRRLRKKIEEDPRQPRHVLTVHGAGYRFVPGEATPADPPHATATESRAAPASRERARPADPGFVGRADELAALDAAMRRARLVTLWGPGGAGKTRLARRWAGDADGFAPLASVRSAEGVDAAVAESLGTTPDALASALAARPRTLILDNVEQIVAEVAERVESWLDAAPELAILVTSRTRLGLGAEQVIEVGGLAPDDGLALFTARAHAAGGRDLDAPEVTDVLRELVARLDGLPLALELAAGRAGVLSPADLLDRLDDRFAALSTRPPGHGPDRHRALDVALDWSWRLLEATDQRCLAACATFADGFELDAVEAMVGAGALDRVQRLRRRSWIARAPSPPGVVRLLLLESIRDFVAERLPDAVSDARGEHAAFYASAGPRWAARAQTAPRIWRRLLRERDDLVQAAHRVLATDAGPAAAHAATLALAARGPTGAWRVLADATVQAHPGPWAEALRAEVDLALGDAQAAAARLIDVETPSADPRVALTLARAWRGVGRYAEADELLDRALPDAATATRIDLLHQRGLVAYDAGDHHAARAAFEQALDAAEAAGHARTAARVHTHLGHVQLEQGALLEADHHYARAEVVLSDLGDDRGAAIARSHRALVAQELGDGARAEDLIRTALEQHVDVGNQRFIAYSHLIQASLATDAGDWSRAADRAAEARRALSDLGDPIFAAIAAAREGVARCGLGQDRAGRERLDEAYRAVQDADPTLRAGVGELAGLGAALVGPDADGPPPDAPDPDLLARSNFLRIAARQRSILSQPGAAPTNRVFPA